MIKNFTLAVATLLGLISLAPAFALAQTNVGAGVGAAANVTTTGASVGASTTMSAKFTATETKAKGRGDSEIDRRITALNDLNTRVSQMQRVSDAFKQSLNSTVAAEITALSNLKAKVDADTDSATLKADLQSITDGYRVYALVLPQGRIAAAADRVATIANMMGTLGSKLQARVQTAGSAGADVTALNAALVDMSTKLNDSQTQAQAAITVSATLQPDGGDKTKMASNTAALKEARTDITNATKDLQAARKDVDTIVKGLAKVQTTTSASSTTQTTTQTTTH